MPKKEHKYSPRKISKQELKLYLGFKWYKNFKPEEVCDLAHCAKENMEAKELWRDKYIEAKELINRSKNLIAELTLEIDEIRKEFHKS